MSANTRDSWTADGKKFKKMLKELSEMEVRIGFQQGEASEDGVDMCDIAAWNELGTVRSPSRPFLRNSVDDNESKINSFLQSMKNELIAGKPAEQILKQIGIFQKDLVQGKITDGPFDANSRYTIEKKGSDKPLIDTGRMRQSVNYVIKKKGSE